MNPLESLKKVLSPEEWQLFWRLSEKGTKLPIGQQKDQVSDAWLLAEGPEAIELLLKITPILENNDQLLENDQPLEAKLLFSFDEYDPHLNQFLGSLRRNNIEMLTVEGPTVVVHVYLKAANDYLLYQQKELIYQLYQIAEHTKRRYLKGHRL